MAGLYIHIPFCKQACHYCDFHFSTSQENRQGLIRALTKELELQKDYLAGEPLETIYLGGGTPSLLSAEEMETLFKVIHSQFVVTHQPEITLEANPDDLTKDKLRDLKQVGINRLSIGIQSFDDDVLKFFNRAHDAQQAKECFVHAREAGFDNVSVDLIYAIPGQDQKAWEKNIYKLLILNPEHISSYSLTIENKTVFGKWLKNGILTPVDEESAAHAFELLMDLTRAAGYEHYEISNFCKPGLYSRHNSNYWKQTPYLGIGPSAHSYNQVSRQFNISNNNAYTKAIDGGRIPFERETLTTENKINEYIFTTLRTTWGCQLNVLKMNFGYDLLQNNKEYLKEMVDKKLMVIENHVLTLTRSGKLLADKIAADLFVDAKVDS